MAGKAAAKEEKAQAEDKEEAPRPKVVEQMEFDFINQVADGVWAAQVEMRKKGLKMVMQGFAMLGCPHVAVSAILSAEHTLEVLPRWQEALEEEARRNKK